MIIIRMMHILFVL